MDDNLPADSALAPPLQWTGEMTHYVARITYIEGAILAACFVLLTVALARGASKRSLLLLLGFGLLPAKDVVLHATLRFNIQALWPATLANVWSAIGWLCVAAYCAMLAWRPQASGPCAAEADGATPRRAEEY